MFYIDSSGRCVLSIHYSAVKKKLFKMQSARILTLKIMFPIDNIAFGRNIA